MTTLKASTQYNDFEGTAAADIGDNKSLKEWLVSKSLMSEAEVILGVEIVFNENSGRAIPDPGIVAYVADGPVDRILDAQNDGTRVEIRAIDIPDLPIAEFFAFYKRFNVVLVKKGIEIPENIS